MTTAGGKAKGPPFARSRVRGETVTGRNVARAPGTHFRHFFHAESLISSSRVSDLLWARLQHPVPAGAELGAISEPHSRARRQKLPAHLSAAMDGPAAAGAVKDEGSDVRDFGLRRVVKNQERSCAINAIPPPGPEARPHPPVAQHAPGPPTLPDP